MFSTRPIYFRVAPVKLLEQADEELIARVKQQDSQALEVLYDRYAAQAMGIALKIVREPAAAEEIVQEAFWRAWKSADSYDESRGAVAYWLFGIVRNLAIDELRRRASRPVNVDGDENEQAVLEIPDGAPDVSEVVWNQWQADQIHKAVMQLPDVQRQVIQLAYFQGLTRVEIAERLGEPPGTIHTRARLALQKLRTVLAPLGLED